MSPALNSRPCTTMPFMIHTVRHARSPSSAEEMNSFVDLLGGYNSVGRIILTPT